MRIRSFALALAVASAFLPNVAANDAVFQFAITLPTAKRETTAFLWIPHEAKQIRGVVMAGMTLAERELVKDPQVRKACAAEQLALVFLKTGLEFCRKTNVIWRSIY